MIFYDDYHDNAPVSKGANMLNESDTPQFSMSQFASKEDMRKAEESSLADTPISDAARSVSEPHGFEVVPYAVAQQLERDGLVAATQYWRDRFNSECALYNQLAAELRNERLMRYETEVKLKAETERCAKVAADYCMSPVVGKAIAALIMHGGVETISAPVEPKEVYSPHTAVSN